MVFLSRGLTPRKAGQGVTSASFLESKRGSRGDEDPPGAPGEASCGGEGGVGKGDDEMILPVT